MVATFHVCAPVSVSVPVLCTLALLTDLPLMLLATNVLVKMPALTKVFTGLYSCLFVLVFAELENEAG